MTDHANELRRYSRKIGHPAGDVPSVMLAAADEIERLAAMLEAAEKSDAESIAMYRRARDERDALRAKIETAENDAAHQKALAASALRVAEGWERKCGELRAKVAEMGQQEPLDADSDVFRSAFEAALKAGNWPATRQGDGYRSPSTQIAWRIAFSTVNRLKLYLAPGAKGE